MNYTIIPSKKSCNRCSNIGSIDAKYCSACGASFVFGKPDEWQQQVFTNNPYEHKCLREEFMKSNPDVKVMGLSCSCPKCSPR